LKSKNTFRNKLLSAFAISCLVVFALVMIVWQLSRNADNAMVWVQHSYKVLNSVVQTRADTILIELNTQSFRITGDEKRIVERDNLIQAREQSLNLIKQSTSDNPNQQNRWHKLRKVIDERLEISRRMVILRKTQGQEAADKYIATTPLQATRDLIHALLVEMENEERHLLTQRLNELQHARQLTSSVGIIVGILLIVFLIITFLIIRRQFIEIEVSHNELAESESKLSITLHSIGDAVVATDTEGRINRMNSVSEKLTGWKLTEAIGRPIEEVFNIINEKTGMPAPIPVIKVLQTKEIQSLENHTILIARNGGMHPIADSAAPIIDSAGNLSGVVLVFRDVTLERQAEKLILEQNELLDKRVHERTLELRLSEDKLRSVTDNVPALIAYVDANKRYVYANQKYLERFAPTYSNIEGLSVSEVLGSDRYAFATTYIDQALSGISISYDWQPFPNVWQMVNYVPTIDKSGKVDGYYVLISDITDRKNSEIELYKITHIDSLTNLPNAIHFTQLLSDAIAASTLANQSFSLLQINIEKLSEINDALGFSEGDTVLKEFADRLKYASQKPCSIARLRGDEFAILISNCTTDEAVGIVGRLENLLAKPIIISNIPLEISAKIGIAIFPDHGSSPHDLYKHVDSAVRQAKKKGRRYFIFDQNEEADKTFRLALAAELRHAIDQNELELYLQPKVSFNTFEVCSVEALIRWNHPVRGLVSPSEFIPLAEQISLIRPLTQWVINTAMEILHHWEDSKFIMPISLNLSARNLHEDDLVERIHHMKEKWSINPKLLELEITESSIMDEAQNALIVLKRIREEGFDLSIDDFGTGYSSLSYLQRLPMQYLKIDQSFVREMLNSKESLMIVKSTIDLAHDLGKKVVAEGVETREHWEKLAELGCDIAQGYFIAKPMSVNSFLNWLKDFKPLR
jgi:diguanylate cyclase (GGDEF)-like protein/PAS domain S-box-containing protein